MIFFICIARTVPRNYVMVSSATGYGSLV